MKLEAATRPAAIVVGADGSERNLAAINWAADLAVRANRNLRMVAVAAPSSPSQPSLAEPIQYPVEITEAYAGRVRQRLGADAPTIDFVERCGRPARELIAELVPDDVLVVGRRGIGPLERAVLGRTAMALAGASAVPTVIVPDHQQTHDHPGGSIVAGVDGSERDSAVLDFAFEQAVRSGQSLVVVGAWELWHASGWMQAELGRLTEQAEIRLSEEVQPWTKRYPGVAVTCSVPVSTPATALLGHEASLIVVGRTGVKYLGAFSGLSTLRKVLHHADGPVAVVPVAVAADYDFDESDVPEF